LSQTVNELNALFSKRSEVVDQPDLLDDPSYAPRVDIGDPLADAPPVDAGDAAPYTQSADAGGPVSS